jgi:hypothetical protein
MVVGVLLLAAVGVITSTLPARDALQANQRLGYVGSYQEKGVTFNLWLAPGRVGDNEVAVDVSDARPLAAGRTPEVFVRFLSNQPDLGQVEVKATSKDGQRFSVHSSYLPVAGEWIIEVELTTPGLSRVDHQFEVNVRDNISE